MEEQERNEHEGILFVTEQGTEASRSEAEHNTYLLLNLVSVITGDETGLLGLQERLATYYRNRSVTYAIVNLVNAQFLA